MEYSLKFSLAPDKDISSALRLIVRRKRRMYRNKFSSFETT